MSYDMLTSYSPTHGVGVDVRVLDFKMHWNGFPLTSNFYIKIIKYPDEIIPKLYCSRKLFTLAMNPTWNDRKIVRFKFDYIQTSYVKEMIGELVDDDPREPNYSCFDIAMLKVREGPGNIFYPLRASRNGGTTIGLGEDQIMNMSKDSFDKEVGIIEYEEYPGRIVWEFYFGFRSLTDVWSPNEADNSIQRIRNPLYMSVYNITTGNLAKNLTMIKFLPLFTPQHNIQITVNSFPDYVDYIENPLWIMKGTKQLTDFPIRTRKPTEVGIIPFTMASDDLFYRTYNERIKQIQGRTFYIVNVRTGIDGPLYVIYLKIITFEVVNSFGLNLATIELGGATQFFIKVIPENALADIAAVDATIFFTFTNTAPHLMTVPKVIAYPARDELNQPIEPTFNAVSSGAQGDSDEFNIPITVTSEYDAFNGITDISAIQVNIANLYINVDYVLIDIYDLNNLKYSNKVQVLPRRYEDITETLNLSAVSKPSTADFVTFNYTTKVVNNQFVITEVSSLATTLTVTTYNDILAGKQGDILYFDTSDPSNFGHKLSFFAENNGASQQLLNENGELLAEYSRGAPQGTPTSWCSIRLPVDRLTVWYRTYPDNPRQNYVQYGFGKIELSSLEYYPIGDILVGPVDGTLEGGEVTLVSNGRQGQVDISIGVASNSLFGEQNLGTISARAISITPPINVTYYIDNDTWNYLSWEVEEDGNTIYSFADPTKTRYTTEVYYEILRQTFVTGESEYVVIGTSDKCEYLDETGVRFGNYRYKIRTVIRWNNVEVRSSPSDFIFVFICQNNRFPFGRWNNTTSNPKLYKNIQPNCEKIGQTTTRQLTTNLFPNSKQMTAAQIYTMHAQSNGRPQR